MTKDRANGALIILSLVLLLALVSFLVDRCNDFTVPPESVRTDTVYVPKQMPVYSIPKSEHWPVAIVTYYLADTTARRKAEQGDIITGVSFDSQRIVVDKIDPKGVGIQFTYKLPNVPVSGRIDGTGAIALKEDKKSKRKEFWNKVGRKVAIVGAFAAGVFIGIKLSN